MKKLFRSFLFMVSFFIAFLFSFHPAEASGEMDLISGIEDIYVEVGTELEDIVFIHDGITVKEGFHVMTVTHGLKLDTVNHNGYTVSYLVTDDNLNGVFYPIKVYVLEANDFQKETLLSLREGNEDIEERGITYYALEEITKDDLLSYVEATGILDRDLSHLIEVEGLEQLEYRDIEQSYEITFKINDRIRVHNGVIEYNDVLTVNINLEDTVGPTITQNEPINIDVNSTDVSYESFITIRDDYDHYHGLETVVQFDDKKVDLTKIGTYELVVTATDQKGNVTIKMFDVNVVDQTPPEIIGPDKIEHKIGEEKPDYLSMITVEDNYYKTVETIYVHDDQVNYEKPGAYIVTIVAYDKSMNIQVKEIIVRVFEDVEEESIFDVITDFDGKIRIPKHINGIAYYDFKNHLVINNGNIIHFNVNTSSVKYDKPGEYDVEYYVIDSKGQAITETVTVVVEDDNTPPVIEGLPERIVLPVYIKYYDFKEGITISDDRWDDPMLKIEGSVDFNFVGTYTITYIGEDYSGNVVKHEVLVDIVDDVAPVIVNRADAIKIDVDEDVLNYLDFIEIEDNYYSLEELDITVDDADVNYGVIGKYTVTYRISDPSGNVTKVEIPVYIEDNVPALVEVEGPLVVEVGERPDYWEYVTVNDNYDSEEHLTVEFIDDSINFDRVGEYVATIRVIDRSNNVTEKQVQVLVVDTVAPMIKGIRDISIKKGKKINLLEGITAFDKVDGDLTNRLQIEGDYDLNKRGKYLITVKVTDLSGNEAVETFILTVKANYLPILYIPLAISLVFSTIGIIVYYSKQEEDKMIEEIVEDDWRLV